ncbi:unnamed protein product [Amaranthus hypochondriacus]
MGKGAPTEYQPRPCPNQEGEIRLGLNNSIADERILTENTKDQFVDKRDEYAKDIEQRVRMEVEFPTLGNSRAKYVPTSLPQNNQQGSWKDKVASPNIKPGMPLKFIAPIVENGQQIVQIESNDLNSLVNVWKRAVVMYVVGEKTSIDIIRGFTRKHWAHVKMPVIHTHDEGYYILQFHSERECEEILLGGPYFLNRAPIVVKKWSVKFDFKDEILRVIPVWVRLPSLPLHCWGEETLSRIVSAVGVPIMTDECTAKQLKISYARILVEVDITKNFLEDIKVRDNLGREFFQKAIPEWRPYFCHKCNKVGHECKEGDEAPIKRTRFKEKEEKTAKEKKNVDSLRSSQSHERCNEYSRSPS